MGVRSAVGRINKKLSIQLAAGILAGSAMLSAILGIFRNRLLNGLYFDNYAGGLGAYLAAFSVPDFVFTILVSGALSVTFIPVFTQRLASGNKRSAWELSTSLINLMALATLAASVLIIIFAEPVVRYFLLPGYSESYQVMAAGMMRVIAISPFLFAISAVIGAMQQAVGRFVFFALSPVMYNIGIIIGTVWFTNGINLFGWQIFEGGIMGVALGVVLGAVLQLAIATVGLLGLGFDYRYKIYWKNKGFRRVLGLLPARSLDQGMDYVVGFAEINLASRMSTNTLAAYNQAATLHMMPVNLIGLAIGTAAFPKMSELLAQDKKEQFKHELRQLLRWVIWLALPVSIVAYFARGYVVHFIKNEGDPLIAGFLGALVIAILFRSIYHIVSRSFYAQQDTKTPLFVSIFAILLNIGLAIWFSLSLKWGGYGLAIASSLTAVIEVLILVSILGMRFQGLFDKKFIRAITRMLSVSGFTAIVAYVMVLWFPVRVTDLSFLSVFPKFCLITAVSFAFYITLSHFVRLSEAEPIINKVKRILFPQKVIRKIE